MRLALVIVLAACSNAANPTPDAAPMPVDAREAVDAAAPPTYAPPLGILVVNEVAAAAAPDWFEVVNASTAAVQLDAFCYMDSGAVCTPFPAVTLAAGGHHAQDVDDAVSGFKLGSDEELWVFRIADQRFSDGVNWAEGASPSGSSYARSPDTSGGFVTGAPSRGLANP